MISVIQSDSSYFESSSNLKLTKESISFIVEASYTESEQYPQ